ncbi:serine/threonine-protein kinase [Colletotrichum sojae]|uniref:EKC/KEOPS complex subunit BUD32 n=1 Tax=Colletotrichum sojae TaxID=2175907 RepID=A0A8H6IMG6_9PEZI|nr:serine/threonine-protein kinase [Colletotrichum sojae]
MEIVETAEAFKRGADGKLYFHHTEGIVRYENKVFTARWNGREITPVEFAHLENPVLLETEDRGPLVKPSWTLAPPDGSYYIKTPSLSAYQGDVQNLILREIETYETLKQYPHPNIIHYYGYREKNGRVSGLCLQQCATTLAEMVDPGHLNKSEFLSSGRLLVDDTIRLNDIRSAIHHLHSLGLVHNDITPSNIFIAEDGKLVLGDFDSSCRNGTPLSDVSTGTKRTHGWHDPDVSVASQKNDLDAVDELDTWLFGSSDEDFLFK